MRYRERGRLIVLALAVSAGCAERPSAPAEDGRPTGAGPNSESRAPLEAASRVRLELVAEGLTAPVQLLTPPDESGRLFVLDQPGVVRVIGRDGRMRDQPFLDLREGTVEPRRGFDERGLLGMAFHPDYRENGRFFVYYSAPLREEGPEGWDHTGRLSEFRASSDPDAADPGSERVVIEVDQPQFNHNGGTVAFGPDGYLYLSLGDGGGAGDEGLGHPPQGNGQDITTLLGSIVRIDIDGARPYEIPRDNPFADSDGAGEIFAYGLRNPYRISWDFETGRLYAADVGQDLFEEVNLIEAGGNYGWPTREGARCFDSDSPLDPPAECPSAGPRGEPLIDPVISYAHPVRPGGLGISVIGGMVYRGEALPELRGRYVFGDWSLAWGAPRGRLFVSTPRDEPGPWTIEALEVEGGPEGALGRYLLGLGADGQGEVYALVSDMPGPGGETGKVFRIAPAGNGRAEIETAGGRMAEASVEAPGEASKEPSDERVVVELSARNFRFDRDAITVPAGADVVVRFTNHDPVAHNFALYEEEGAAKAIFSGPLLSGPTRVIHYGFRAPDEPGTYHFQCDPHPRMNGRFVVE